ncbi:MULTISPECIES: hypothetical protein [unclassified Pseudoxanthomonas]|uniref:hypothetical protein n=1 Tax=unclassified Pseudoxanthomonas TaxID=2645906 RepID=UPI0030787525
MTQAGRLSAWEIYRNPARDAVNEARAELARYAATTDTPEWGAVIAADLLDAALSALAGAQ